MKKDSVRVSPDMLVKICTAFNCTLDDNVEIVPGMNKKMLLTLVKQKSKLLSASAGKSLPCRCQLVAY